MPALTKPSAAVWPWAFVAVTFFVLLVLVVGRNFLAGGSRQAAPGAGATEGTATTGQGDGPLADSSVAGSPAATEETGPVAGGSARAGDISALSPRERADRLFDRVMRLSEQGKRDSVEFFSPMVIAAYQMSGPLDLDQHYDLGRIGAVTGVADLARAEADTILRANPTHLLGLALAADAARAANRTAAARSYYARLVTAAPSELQKSLPEYARHRRDIDAGLATARSLGVGKGP